MTELFYRAAEADLTQGSWRRKDTHSELLKLIKIYVGKPIEKSPGVMGLES